MATLQERIKERRTVLGFTLLEVAELLGVKEATMQRYESGEIKNIKHDTIVEMAKIFKCSPQYLMGWTDMVMERKIQQPITKDNKFQQLIDNYNKLNEEGQEKLLDYSDDLVSSQKYIKNNQYIVGREA